MRADTGGEHGAAKPDRAFRRKSDERDNSEDDEQALIEYECVHARGRPAREAVVSHRQGDV